MGHFSIGGHGGGRSCHGLGLGGQRARILDLVENFQSFHSAMLFSILLVATHTGVLSSINFTSQGEDNIGGNPGGSNHSEGNSPAQFVQKLNWVPFSWVIRHFLSLLGFLGSRWQAPRCHFRFRSRWGSSSIRWG